MNTVIQTVAHYSRWIYGIVAVLGLWYLRAAWLAHKERKRSIFTLEREMALNRTYNIYVVAIFLALVLAFTYFVTKKVSPVVAEKSHEASPEELLATPTPLFRLQTPTPVPTATPTPSPTPARKKRPTRRFIPPPATATPAPPPVKPPACPNPGVKIVEPGDGATVKGVVVVKGTAAIPDFQYYKLEFGPGDNPKNWSFINSWKTPVSNGVLAQWNVAALPPGRYSLRLVVVDKRGNYPQPCVTHINITK